MRIILLLMSLLPGLLLGQRTLLRGVELIDVDAGEKIHAQDVWISGGLIDRIAPTGTLNLPADDTLYLPGKYVMPGLVDGHMHHFQSGGLFTRPDVVDLRGYRPYEEELAQLEANRSILWQRYLAAGITTIMDVGGPFSNYDLRSQSDTLGLTPKVLVTGPLLSSYQPEELTTDDPPIIRINSPEEGRTAVQDQLPLRPDFIKIWYIVQRGEAPETFFPIAQAICEEAHAAGIPVAVHATQLETARKAVEAGADLLVHSVDDKLVDSAFVSLLLEKEVYYCPTLTVSYSYEEVLYGELDLRPADWRIGQGEVIQSLWMLAELESVQRPSWVDRLLIAALPADAEQATMQQNLLRLARAGVPIITGTDAGNIGTLHASSYQEELEAMAATGLSPAAILKASTLSPATFLGEKAGKVAEGNRADLLILPSNPLEDLNALASPSLIIRDGQLIRPSDLINRGEEELVKLWLSAWKLGDEQALQTLTHPAATINLQGRRLVGRDRVILMMANRAVPNGIPQIIQQEKGWLIQWGGQRMLIEVKEGKLWYLAR